MESNLSYCIVGMVYTIFAFYMFFTVKEMNNQDQTLEAIVRKKSSCKEFKKAVASICKISMNNRDINLFYVGSFLSSILAIVNYVFTNLLIADHFGNTEEEIREYKNVLQMFLGLNTLIAIVSSFIASILSDVVTMRYSLTFTFAVSSLFNLLIIYIDDPTEWLSIFIFVGMSNSGIVSVIFLISYFNKSLKNEYRGSMSGIQNFFSTLGIIVGTKLGQYLYQNYDHKGPFYMGSASAALYTVCIILFKFIIR